MTPPPLRSALFFALVSTWQATVLSFPVKQVSTGSALTCALLVDGSVKCWGGGFLSVGQLGYGDSELRGDEPNEMGDLLPRVDLGVGVRAVQIDAGFDHVCALLVGGKVKCWGNANKGKLGLGNVNNRGDEPGEMGDNLPFVDLGLGITATQISCGNDHTCALLSDGTVKCWGTGTLGIHGNGDTDNRGDRSGEMGDNLPIVNLGSGERVKQISAGSGHTCVVLRDGRVKCWGVNTDGRLGYGDKTDRGADPARMGDNLLAVDLGTGRTAKQIDAGLDHTCAVLDNSSVKCWGASSFGHLGYEDSRTRGDEPGEMGNDLPVVNLGTGRTVIEVVAGSVNSCAIMDDSSVKCWGFGSGGRLGTGNSGTTGAFPGDMGNVLRPVLLGTGRRATQVTGGIATHICALLDNSGIKCWGAGSKGQLGYGSTLSRSTAGTLGDNMPIVELGFTDSPSAFPTPRPVVPSAATVAPVAPEAEALDTIEIVGLVLGILGVILALPAVGFYTRFRKELEESEQQVSEKNELKNVSADPVIEPFEEA